MARLGHASPQASMIYQHAADERDGRITEGLGARGFAVVGTGVDPVTSRFSDVRQASGP